MQRTPRILVSLLTVSSLLACGEVIPAPDPATSGNKQTDQLLEVATTLRGTVLSNVETTSPAPNYPTIPSYTVSPDILEAPTPTPRNRTTDRAPASDVSDVPEMRFPEQTIFTVKLSDSSQQPVWLQAYDETGHPDWFHLYDPNGQPVYFEERCGVDYCHTPEASCELSPPKVRIVLDENHQSRQMLVEWDGMTTIREDGRGCDLRVRSIPGEYAAVVCWSRSAHFIANQGDPHVAIPGELVNPVCAHMSFRWPVEEVLFEIPAEQY